MRDAALRLDVAARNIAGAASDGFMPSRVLSAAVPGGGVQSTVTLDDVQGVELPVEIVNTMLAQAAFTANAHVLASTLRTERRVLDLLA